MNKKFRRSLSMVVTAVMLSNFVEDAGINAFAATEDRQAVENKENDVSSVSSESNESTQNAVVNENKDSINNETIIDDKNAKNDLKETPEEVKEAAAEKIEKKETEVNTEIAVIDRVNRIYDGNGTVEDYAAIGINNVSDKLQWINAEVKEKVDKSLGKEDVTGRTNSIKSAVNTSLNYYSYVKSINDGKETSTGNTGNTTTKYCINEYVKIGGGYIKWDANITILRNAIKIGKYAKGRDLTKSEILSIKDKALKNPDTKFVEKPILDALSEAEKVKDSNLTADESLKVIDKRNKEINDAYEKIVQGNASIEDYTLIQISGVTKENITWLNAEIREGVDIKLTSENVDGKINNVQGKISNILSIYSSIRNINDGKETSTGNTGNTTTKYCINEYVKIGGGYIKWDANITILRNAIKIGRFAKGRDLTKQEILSIENKATKNPDTKFVEKPILDALNAAQTKKGSNLTPQESLDVIDKRNKEINDAYERIVKGNGSFEDYTLIQIGGVTKENITWLNAEIREGVDIKLTSENVDGKINNVQSKISNILSIYSSIRNINDGKETSTGNTGNTTTKYCISEYVNIGGGYVKWDNYITLLRNAIKIGRFAKGRDLTKQEILSIENRVIKNPDTKFVEKPILDALNNAQTNKGSNLTPEESLVVIDKSIKAIDEAYERIVHGNGLITDYGLIQITGVTSANITWLNAEIKENIDIKLSFEKLDGKISHVQKSISDILLIYPNIRKINDGKETSTGNTGNTTTKYCIAEYANIGGGYIKWDDNILLLQNAIKIGRFAMVRDLTKQEILAIKTKALKNLDSRFEEKPVLDALIEAEKNKGSKLTQKESLIIIDDVIEGIDEAYERIVRGEGWLSDYALLQIKGVNAENYVWINAEIKEGVDIKLPFETVDGKISHIQSKVTNILNIYPSIRKINDGKETSTGNTGNTTTKYCIAEYANIGGGYVKWDANIILLQNAIKIGRFVKGRDLTKQEILSIEKKVIKNPDTKFVEKPILDALNAAQIKKGSNLTPEESKVIIDYKYAEINTAYSRIIKGDGKLEDFKFIQISGVTKENITWLNAEIKENIDIKLTLETKDGKINNLQNNISSILTIYPYIRRVNDGKETSTGNTGNTTTKYCISEYNALGAGYIKWDDNIVLLRKTIAIARDAKGRDLTKQEILKVIKDTRSNPDSKYIVEPIRAAINNVKSDEGTTTDDILNAIDDTLLAVDDSYEKIVNGDGTIEDFNFVQITGVTSENITWLNAEIKEKSNIDLPFETENGKINNVQNKINNILKIYSSIRKINDGKETSTGNTGNTTTKYCIAEYVNIAGIYVKWDNNITILRSAIKIGRFAKGRDLTKGEILSIENKATKNPDTKYVEKPILDALNAAEKEKGSKLTPGESIDVINKRNEEIDGAYERIVHGNASLSDYKLIQILGVTDANITWLNAEIREGIDIKLTLEAGNGKINNVQNKINDILKIYPSIRNINDGKETSTGNTGNTTTKYCIAEYANIGGGYIKWDTSITLLQNAIKIGRFAKGRDLTKQEILLIKNKAIKNPDTKFVEKPILDALNEAQTKKGSKLTPGESIDVINKRNEEIDGAYERIVHGNASLSDYKLIQILGVTDANITWLNAEIREGIDIKLTLEAVNGKINNVQNKINDILKIYPSIRNINDGKETSTGNTGNTTTKYCIKEYANIGGGYIKWDTNITRIRQAIASARAEKGRDLTKQEILKAIK